MNPRPLTTADHSAAEKALHVACLCVGLCAGKTPEEVAAAVLSRVIHNLRAKLPTEAAQREVER
jgi:hypothetical protein